MEVIAERAASLDFADARAGTTGLLVKDYKGKDADGIALLGCLVG
jgi:hypothetical protein